MILLNFILPLMKRVYSLRRRAWENEKGLESSVCWPAKNFFKFVFGFDLGAESNSWLEKVGWRICKDIISKALYLNEIGLKRVISVKVIWCAVYDLRWQILGSKVGNGMQLAIYLLIVCCFQSRMNR